MRKTLYSLILGAALLAPCADALAEAHRPAEPGWGIRPEKNRPPLLDFARWLSERFGRVALPGEPEAAPVTAPAIRPDPDPQPTGVCPPRDHCPIG